MATFDALESPRILSGVAGEIWVKPYLGGATSTATVLTCTVTDEAGTTVATPTPTWSSPKIVAALTASQNSRPRKLKATWGFTAGGTVYALETWHEAVGALLFDEAGVRAWDGSVLASTTDYPAEQLLAMRDAITDEFSDILGVPLGLRGARVVMDGSGSREQRTPHWPLRTLRAVSERTRGTQTWTAYTADELADVLVYREGRLVRETLGTFASGERNLAVEYDHGIDPIPGELRQAGMSVARLLLVRSNINDRALFITSELGQMRLAAAEASRSHWFGLPLVDAQLQRLRGTYRAGSMGVG